MKLNIVDKVKIEGVVGFTCGAFDLLHPGHIHLLNTCAHLSDYLIIGLHTNPSIDRQSKNKPVQSVFERWCQIAALGIKGEIIPYDTERDLANMLATLPINVRFIGSDYIDPMTGEFMNITGEDICKSRNIHIECINRLHSWSSSELRERLKK